MIQPVLDIHLRMARTVRYFKQILIFILINRRHRVSRKLDAKYSRTRGVNVSTVDFLRDLS